MPEKKWLYSRSYLSVMTLRLIAVLTVELLNLKVETAWTAIRLSTGKGDSTVM